MVQCIVNQLSLWHYVSILHSEELTQSLGECFPMANHIDSKDQAGYFLWNQASSSPIPISNDSPNAFFYS